MSIFGKIASAIFGGQAHAAAPTEADKSDVIKASPAAIPGPAVPASAASPAAVAKPTVDVEVVLDAIDSDEDLDWRKSIVDLMKLLKLDSSLKSRKELASELHYSGDVSDSATMNVWLHKQVMTKLAENGGIVPKELQH